MNKKVYDVVMSGKADNNLDFNDFKNLIESLGFILRRQSGSHRFYKHPNGIVMNIQPKGSKAKPYQVAQLRDIIKGGL